MPRLLPADLVLATVLALTAAHPLRGEVVDASPDAFTVHASVTIAKEPARVYETLTRDIGRWWDSSHTYSGSATNLTLQATPGGCFCERLPQGGVEHMTVIYAEPGTQLRMRGGLGPLQALPVTGVWTLTLTDAGGRTTVESTYSVSGHSKPGLDELAPLVDRVMSEQLAHLKQFAER